MQRFLKDSWGILGILLWLSVDILCCLKVFTDVDNLIASLSALFVVVLSVVDEPCREIIVVN